MLLDGDNLYSVYRVDGFSVADTSYKVHVDKWQ